MTADITDHPIVKKHIREVFDAVDYAAIDIPALVVRNKEPMTNPAKYGVKWEWTPTDPDEMELDGAIGASDLAQAFVERPGVQGGDIEFLGAMAKPDDRFACMISSQSLNLEMCNRPISSGLLFGRGTAGSPWRTSFYEPGNGALNFACANLVEEANQPRITAFGRRFIGQEAQDSIEARRARFLGARINPFFAGPDGNRDADVEFPLAAGGTLELQITMPSVGDFLALSLRDDSTRSSGDGIPAMRVQIIDGLSGYELMKRPVDIQLVAAMSLAAIDPRLGAPSFEGSQLGVLSHVFARSSKAILRFYSDDDEDITVRTALEGVILRYKPAPNRDTNLSAQVRDELLRRGTPMTVRNLVEGGRS